jgi:Tol biopolymer transport system component
MNLRSAVGVACLATLVASASVRAGDIRALSHPAGSLASTSNAMSFLSSATAGTAAPASCFSSDGRFVTFSSWSSNLVPGQINLTYISVYVTDLSTGVTSIVSHDVNSTATTGNGPTAAAAISSDGRWISYSGSPTNVVAGMAGGTSNGNVFLYDRLSGANTLVSHRAGAPLAGGNGDSFSSWVSADGGVVVFLSKATDLVPSQVLAHDPSGMDVFVFDRGSGVITLASRSSVAPSRTGNASSPEFVASADGRFISFSSFASDLVSSQVDAPDTSDVFLFDVLANTMSLVSRFAGAPSVAGNGLSLSPSISGDGRFVAYTSYANDLVPGMVDLNAGFADVFLFDRLSGTNALVSHAPGLPATTPDAGSSLARISADGSAVAYASLSTALVSNQVDPNGLNWDVFVFERTSGVNTLVSRSATAATQTGNAPSINPVISADGNRIAFESLATDLVPGQVDTNGVLDVFLFDRLSGKTALVSRSPSSPVATGNWRSSGPLLCGDGNLVAFNSYASDLVPSDTNGTDDAFLFRAVSLGSAGMLSPLLPCRLVDTRIGGGLAGGSPIAAASTQDFPVTGLCGVAADATSLSLSVAVTLPEAGGFVDVFPAGLPTPPTAIVSFRPGQTRANNAIVALGGTPPGTVTVRNASPGPVHVILDVNGYFR